MVCCVGLEDFEQVREEAIDGDWETALHRQAYAPQGQRPQREALSSQLVAPWMTSFQKAPADNKQRSIDGCFVAPCGHLWSFL